MMSIRPAVAQRETGSAGLERFSACLLRTGI
jgi:hypothetical protein